MLRIWGRKTSVNVQKVMWTVTELGLANERIDAGGPFGKVDTPEFAALNPNRLVPVVDDNGFIIWESNACVRYLAGLYGRGGLAPATAHDFAHADAWMDWTLTTLYPDIIGTLFYQFVRVTSADRNRAAIDTATKRAGEKLAILDGQLAGKAFVMGDQLTIADIALGSIMYRYHTMPVERASHPNVEAWYQRLVARPAYKDHVMVDWQGMKIPGA